MAKTAQHPPADFYDGEAMRHLLVNLARTLDQSPKEVEKLHTILIKTMHSIPGVSPSMPQHELVQLIYQPCVDAVARSKSAGKLLDTIIERYGKLPSTPTIRLAKGAENSIMIAIMIGLVCGALIVGAACLYLAARY